MLRTAFVLILGVFALSFGTVTADEKKKDATTKLEGKLCCTKCSLGETKTCGHALKVKDGDKEVVYYIDDKGAKEEYHKQVCTEEKDATVEGKVEEKDKKKHVTSPKVTIK